MALYGSRERATRSDAHTAHERAALITFDILEGAMLSTAEIAERVGVTYHGARYMMEAVSRVVPIYDDEGGVWRRME